MTSNSIGPSGTPSKLLGLELIRFACAMTILVLHFRNFAKIGDGSAMLGPHEPLYALLWPLYDFGHFSVQIFWCISGFIFYWNYADAIAARRIEPTRFFWLRFSRLYPLHFVTLLIVAALQPIYVALTGQHFMMVDTDMRGFILQLALADQWMGPRPISFNAPIWSVSTEVLVYVAFFILLRAFGKSRWLIVGAIALALLSIWSTATSAAVICGGYFFAGGAVAESLRNQWVRRNLGTARMMAAAAAGAVIVLGTMVDLRELNIMLTWLMAICPPLLFLAAQDMPLLDRWQKVIQAAGNLTYSTYLIHFPIQLAVVIVALAGGIELPVGEAWFLFAYLATILALGRIIFLRFEAPMQTWIRSAALTPAPVRAAT